jgi:hypothetical protein
MSDESRQKRREKMHRTSDKDKMAERESILDRKYEEQLEKLRSKKKR